MNTTIRKEIARLWYALKIAAGTGPAAVDRTAREAVNSEEETRTVSESTREGQSVTPTSRRVESPEAYGGSTAVPVADQPVDAGKDWASGAASVSESDADPHGQKRAVGRSPALVVLSRAGRSNVQAQHRRSMQADGRRPAYALPYSPHLAGHVGGREGAVVSAAANSAAASAARQGARGTLIDGDAGVVV
ncbi:MAG TPA: hypothetical protein VL424_13850 [Pararobbsia sp.]|jgi:hypothetical protein|nr:hypothetical protein [Pararobbsia sp.]